MTGSAQFSASPSMAGYMYQSRLALLQGLRMAKLKPEGQISIEKFDDVSFESDNLVECMFQAKHQIQAKSLDDKSTDVWKTLRIWIEKFQADPALSLSTRFVLMTTGTAQVGGAMELLRPGCAQNKVKEASSRLLLAAKESTNQQTKIGREKYIELTAGERTKFLSLVEVMDNSPNLINMWDEIIGELRILSPDHVDNVARYLEGWWVGIVALRLVNDGSATIPVQDILRKASEIGTNFQANNLVIDDPSMLGVKEYSESDEGATFVKQMRRVKLMDSSVERGVRDYYRSHTQRSKWARENLLLDGETSKYDSGLKDAWERQRDSEMIVGSPSTEDLKELFGRKMCMWAQSQQIPFRNVIETWITAGSLHALADRLQIGWHPDFKEIFEKEKVEHEPN